MAENELIDPVKERQKLISIDYLNGNTNQIELAKKYNVTQATISRDIRTIREQWSDEAPKKRKESRETSVRQLYHIAHTAMESFAKSTEPKETIVYEERKDICPRCRGDKYIKGKLCATCDGKGKIDVKALKKTIEGREGNVTFLDQYRKCLQDISKLLGLPVERRGRKPRESNELIIDASSDDDGMIEGTPEEILDAMKAIKRIGSSKKSKADDE